jgi:tetratricopeptide (TPR) repeat protein
MKIIRWLLSHSLFILLIVAVIYVYMFWGNLLGKDTPAGKAVAYLSDEFVEVKEFVNAIKAKQAQLSNDKSQGQQSSGAVADASAGADTTEAIQATESIVTENQAEESSADVANMPAEQTVSEQAAIAVPVTAAEQQPVITGDEQDNMAVPQSAASADSNEATAPMNDAHAYNQQTAAVNNPPSVPANAFATASNTAAERSFVPAEVERQLNNVDEYGDVIDPSQPTGAIRELWITARKSYYQRNYELSEKSYQQVIENTKNNYDAYGELGNVYFNQGKSKEAASAYFEAAAILIKKGRVNQARSLMGLMRHLDKSKASELQQLIDAARS